MQAHSTHTDIILRKSTSIHFFLSENNSKHLITLLRATQQVERWNSPDGRRTSSAISKHPDLIKNSEKFLKSVRKSLVSNFE